MYNIINNILYGLCILPVIFVFNMFYTISFTDIFREYRDEFESSARKNESYLTIIYFTIFQYAVIYVARNSSVLDSFWYEIIYFFIVTIIIIYITVWFALISYVEIKIKDEVEIKKYKIIKTLFFILTCIQYYALFYILRKSYINEFIRDILYT